MFTEIPNANFEFLIETRGDLSERPQISFFDTKAIEFLKELSSDILSDESSRNHGDLIAFAYWIRSSNLDAAVERYSVESNRTGYGMCLHIAPSNVPLNFAYSLVCSLLAGNRNIVRVPSRRFPQVDFLLGRIRKILSSEEFQVVAHAICVIRYEKNDLITKELLDLSNLKVVWGGDNTVSQIRSIPTPAHCKEVVFPDRKSISIIDECSLVNLNENEILKLAERFYIDAYLFDQNACSSPRILFWISNPNNSLGKDRFWNALSTVANSRYLLEPGNLILKFTELAKIVADSDVKKVEGGPGELLSRFDYSSKGGSLSSELTNRFGTFFEQELANLDELAPLLDQGIQTVTYFGIEPTTLLNFVVRHKLKGVDRIVPVGKALDFDFIWDGYDLPRTLSRIVTFI
jgi:hypothetical protein